MDTVYHVVIHSNRDDKKELRKTLRDCEEELEIYLARLEEDVWSDIGEMLRRRK